MPEKIKNFTQTRPRLKKIVGAALVFVGFIALVTPLTPGAALFLFIGFEMLGLKFMFLERIVERRRKVALE